MRQLLQPLYTHLPGLMPGSIIDPRNVAKCIVNTVGAGCPARPMLTPIIRDLLSRLNIAGCIVDSDVSDFSARQRTEQNEK
jgi:hypothetical protein